MQPKVSIVMPCYNKDAYIGEMFDSILAQEWDNIELILVNDGSTDGTRDIIADYEPKFLARGFEVVIIDQENAGVCAAAKAGLRRVTGEYVCMVDADDELDPKYVSTMAGWLAGHPDCDFCVCDAIEYTGAGENKAFRQFFPRSPAEHDPKHLERYILGDIRSEVWVYFVRVGYLRKCRIIDTYHTNTQGSHEPGFIIPLLAFGGRHKCFVLPLYHFNVGCDGHSRPQSLEKLLGYYEEYCRLCGIALEMLPRELLGGARESRLRNLASFSNLAESYLRVMGRYDVVKLRNRVANALTCSANLLFSDTARFEIEDLAEMPYPMLASLKDWLLERWPYKAYKGRIIGYGALGKNAAKLLPHFKGTNMQPHELWDAAGDGLDVKRPDFTSLCPEDLLLVFPHSEKLLMEIKSKAVCRVLSWREIIPRFCLELILNRNDETALPQRLRAQKAENKINMLVIADSFRIGAEVERFLLNFLERLPKDRYQIDLQIFDYFQDDTKMLDTLPKEVNVLPPLSGLLAWPPELEKEFTDTKKRPTADSFARYKDTHDELPDVSWLYVNGWNNMRRLCPAYEGYDHAVAINAGLMERIVATNAPGAKKTVFIHLDYKSAIDSGIVEIGSILWEKTAHAAMDDIYCVTKQNAASFREIFPEFSQKVRALANINDYFG
jgi:glycosyltransferase involved in cell wall biosynthesis